MTTCEVTIIETIVHKHWIDSDSEETARERAADSGIGKVVSADVLDVEAEPTEVLELV